MRGNDPVQDPIQAVRAVWSRVRALLILLTILFALAALATVPLALGAFAGLNPAAPAALRLLSAVEGTLSGRVHLELETFWRGVAYLLGCAGLVWLAAYVKPR